MERDRNKSSDIATGRQIGTAVIPFGQPRKEFCTTSGTTRPTATFIAHLIAANENAPQFRLLRRTEPYVASAAYETANISAQHRAMPMLHGSVTLKIV